jgi:hypothetical protein
MAKRQVAPKSTSRGWEVRTAGFEAQFASPLEQFVASIRVLSLSPAHVLVNHWAGLMLARIWLKTVLNEEAISVRAEQSVRTALYFSNPDRALRSRNKR